MQKNRKNGKKQRRFVTLIEMMIVMFLIALITGVVAYNYRGTLEKGKVFKTEAGIQRLQTILNLAVAEDPSADINNWETIVRQSPLVNDPEALIYDGWGRKYIVGFSDEIQGVVVSSENYRKYKQK